MSTRANVGAPTCVRVPQTGAAPDASAQRSVGSQHRARARSVVDTPSPAVSSRWYEHGRIQPGQLVLPRTLAGAECLSHVP
eukprot:m.1221688 g.1221688  ORF g.1221688 m.1221688 type:complete len:81 (-) comp24624_c0_seq35:2428-2670(-)